MLRNLSTAALLLLLAAPLAAQAPAGLQLRIDKSTEASDPDDVPDVTITTVGRGFQVNTGPAAVVWNPSQTASGVYTLKGKFTLQKPSGHRNYYGLVLGGSSLAAPTQEYVYFLIAQDGSYVIKQRMGEMVHDVVPGRPTNAAIVKPDASGKSVNDLEVRVGADKIDYVVNGTVVNSSPKTGLKTDGIYGVRINHVIPGVLVEGLAVTK
jgi:hypothetical protein